MRSFSLCFALYHYFLPFFKLKPWFCICFFFFKSIFISTIYFNKSLWIPLYFWLWTRLLKNSSDKAHFLTIPWCIIIDILFLPNQRISHNFLYFLRIQSIINLLPQTLPRIIIFTILLSIITIIILSYNSIKFTFRQRIVKIAIVIFERWKFLLKIADINSILLWVLKSISLLLHR